MSFSHCEQTNISHTTSSRSAALNTISLSSPERQCLQKGLQDHPPYPTASGKAGESHIQRYEVCKLKARAHTCASDEPGDDSSSSSRSEHAAGCAAGALYLADATSCIDGPAVLLTPELMLLTVAMG